MIENAESKRRAIVYIDGFNLYFALKEKNWGYFLWLDVVKLGKTLIRSDQGLVRVKYFTSRIKNDAEKQKRQNTYLDALATLDGLDIIEGDYQDNRAICRGCGRSWPDSQEKQTDVNIATHMLIDAYENAVDDVILVTADSDQCPAMEAVREKFKKNVLIVLPPGRGNYLQVQMSADAHVELTAKKFKASLLPDEVKSKAGFTLKRPEKYK